MTRLVERATIATVRIRPAARAAIVRHAVHAHPVECVGLLAGHDHFIELAQAVRADRATPTFFRADALDLARAEEAVRAAGLQLLGYYHSHPNAEPVPSQLDEEAVGWPDLPPFLRLIVAVHAPGTTNEIVRIRAFDIRTRPWSSLRVRTDWAAQS